jgi:hypothetical protein
MVYCFMGLVGTACNNLALPAWPHHLRANSNQNASVLADGAVSKPVYRNELKVPERLWNTAAMHLKMCA